jgi:16S rRNA (cytidine1402-2'-O)-methyltransferase
MNSLYIVSTPIGNLEDITLRAIRILKEVSLILCEDTRHSYHLLQHYEITTPTASYHDFNKEKVGSKYIDHLMKVGSIALISDAGTPGLADPAFNLVRDARKENIPVYPIPGASALLSALVASGVPTDRFQFENFPSKKSATRLRDLELLKETATCTLCFYASPHNLLKFLAEIQTVFGEIRICLARELTKKFEEFRTDTPTGHLKWYKERSPKGEFVLMFHPQDKG